MSDSFILDFDPRVARKIDNVNGAILLGFFKKKQGKSDVAFRASAKEIEAATCLSQRQQIPARKSLVDGGLLIERKRGMPSTLHFSVKSGTKKRRRKEPKQMSLVVGEPVASEPVVVAVSRVEVESGAYDVRPLEENLRDEGLLSFMVNEWSTAWGKSKSRIKVNASRRKSWRGALRDQVSPSMFLRAIWGMTHDDWPERKDRCDWQYVVRHLDRWVDLFDKHGFDKTNFSNMKKIKGILVPVDYVWDQSDEHLLQTGNTFDPVTRRWAKENNGNTNPI